MSNTKREAKSLGASNVTNVHRIQKHEEKVQEKIEYVDDALCHRKGLGWRIQREKALRT